MKIKCIYCETVYDFTQGNCSSCGKRGGYIQEPKLKLISGISVHLEDFLIHKESNNEYQIKEIQKNGIICIVIKSLINGIDKKRAYISNSDIKQYKIKD